MELNWRAIVLIIMLAPLFSGCEELGLEDDDETTRSNKGTDVDPPVVDITEPQVSFPFIRYLYFKEVEDTGSSDPEGFVYSYDISANSVVRQSSGQTAKAFATDIPLGKGRFTQSYVVIEENGNYFRGEPNQQSLIQMGTLSNGLKERCTYQFMANGLGNEEYLFQLRAAGTDSTCNTADDLKQQIDLGSDGSDSPNNISATLFTSLPLQNEAFEIQGYVHPPSADSVQIIDPELTPERTLTGLAGNDFSISRLSTDGNLLLNANGELYLNTSEELVDSIGTLLTTLTSIDQTALTAQDWEVDSESLYINDDGALRKIDLETGGNTPINVNGSTLDGRIAQSEDYLVVHATDNTLYRVEKVGGTAVSIATNTLNDYIVSNNLLYFSTDADSAYIADLTHSALDCATATDCNGGSDADTCAVSEAASGCIQFTNAQWKFMRENLDRGVEYYPILVQSDGAISVTADGDYFYRPTFLGYDTSTGLRLVSIGSLGNEVQITGVGVSEQGNGLLALELDSTDNADPDGEGQNSDIYYLNTRRSNSLKNISSSGTTNEVLISTSELD
ncbi:hypothetical protein [Hahella ganghwensis]|uniref:hypothetical protein n=1 Tax=Hahella ganghwensis TaxID=286420 RepID=UPI00039A3E9B|nr:hypothetical protein [Hahella ganghwensis]